MKKVQCVSESNRRDEENFFMKPSQSFYDSFAGCKVREVLPYPSDGLSREEFKKRAGDIIEEAANEAKRRGLPDAEINNIQLHAMRQVAESSLFFFCVSILNLYYVDNDYGYRLCLDVQENKWGRLWVIAREHLKTTIITIISTIWEVCRNPKATFGVFSYKKPMAKKILSSIEL